MRQKKNIRGNDEQLFYKFGSYEDQQNSSTVNMKQKKNVVPEKIIVKLLKANKKENITK